MANQAQRRADLIKAENELKRQKNLFEKNAISESAFQESQSMHEVAKAAFEGAGFAVRSAEARLQEAEEQLAKTTIFSPMDGTVSKLDVELGERVVGTSQMAGTEMMRVARLDQMEIEVDVNENDIVNVAIGDTAAIEVDAYPERSFRGVVTEIANSARVLGQGTQEQVTNFPVKVRILDPHRMDAETGSSVAQTEIPAVASAPNFRPGMSGTVDVFTHTVPSAVSVPIQAVTVRDFNKVKPKSTEKEDGEMTESPDSVKESSGSLGPQEDLRKVVFLVEEGMSRMVEIETGIADDTHVEVVSGLQGGETVVIGPYRVVSRTLEPDMTVKVQDEEGGPPFARAE